MISKRSVDIVSSYVVKIVLIITIIFLFFPVIISITFAFDPRNFPTFPPIGFTLKWFENFFRMRTFIEGLKWSLIIAVTASGISICIAIPTSFAITRNEFNGKNILLAAFQSPLIVPGVVAGVAFLTFFRGFLNIYSALTNLLIAHTILTFPYTLRTIGAAIAGLDRTLEEAAYSLGMTRWEVIRTLLGYIRSSILAGAFLALGRAMGETVAVAMVVGNTLTFPRSLFDIGYTIPSLIANQFPTAEAYSYMMPALYGGALILFIAGLIINLAGLYWIRRVMVKS